MNESPLEFFIIQPEFKKTKLKIIICPDDKQNDGFVSFLIFLDGVA